MSFSCTTAASIKKYTDMYKKELKSGDLIEIFRDLPICYQHWAVYIGGGYVVHFVTLGSGLTSSSSAGSGSIGPYGAVMKEKLEDVVGNNMWRINNLLDEEFKPRPVNDIVKEACSLVGANLEYDLRKHNCEHFATEMRYGKPESRQVRYAETAATAGVFALLVAAAAAAAGFLAKINRS